MEGTHQFILNHTVTWVTSPQEFNTHWFYGLVGIGKMSLAHSIHERFQDPKHFSGAFFLLT